MTTTPAKTLKQQLSEKAEALDTRPGEERRLLDEVKQNLQSEASEDKDNGTNQ